jgi:glycosyltransferase involved in cell wall biosynthesis
MDMTRPLVSVVMPSFNQAEFIDAAIRSVLEQDYQSLELVIVDGGSTDATLQRLEALLAVFGSRLRWVSEKDSGPANAINKAFQLARGDIIGWLNSDDLYAPAAVSRAVGQLEASPNALMMYGEAEHIDAQGGLLGRYPTRPPSASIQAFHDGCFICQPTVFFRRQVFDAVGYLDEALATAFDFDLWLRVFGSFPDRIAYLAQVQAFSRLHDNCITQKLRRLVAVEGIRVLAKHVGPPRPHWLQTYVEELCAIFPFGDDVVDMRAHIHDFVAQVKNCFDGSVLEAVVTKLFSDARVRLALPGVFVNVHADGWAPAVMVLRIRKLTAENSSLRIYCSHVSPVPGPLTLRIQTSWGCEDRVVVEQRSGFDFLIDVPGNSIGVNLIVLIKSEITFIPREVDIESSDGRELSFRVGKLQWEEPGCRKYD